MLSCKQVSRPIMFTGSLQNVKEMPLDEQLVEMCKNAPECVQPRCALQQFKWCIQQDVDNEGYRVLREFLIGLTSEADVNSLEVMYGK